MYARSDDLEGVEAAHLATLLNHLDSERLLPLVRVSEDGDDVPDAVEEPLGGGGVHVAVVKNEGRAGDGDDLAVLATDLDFLDDDVLEGDGGAYKLGNGVGAIDGLVDGLLVLKGSALDGAVEAGGLEVGGHVSGRDLGRCHRR